MRPLLLVDMYVELSAAPHFTPWLPADFVSLRPADVELPDPREFSAIVLSGSAGSLLEREAWMERAADFTRQAIEHDVPTLGVCFGHQLVAYALSGEDALEKARPPEVGYLDVRCEAPDDELLGVLPPSFRTFVSHEDQVRSSARFSVLARTQACPVHALRVPGKRTWGVQFHTEYPVHEETRIIEYRVLKHPDAGFDREAMLAQVVNTDDLARTLFARFAEVARQPAGQWKASQSDPPFHT